MLDTPLPIPTRPEDEDASQEWKNGFEAFARDVPLHLAEIPHGGEAAARRDRRDGWGVAWNRCYGQGVKCAAAYDADEGSDPDEAESPYPMHSGPWQAWAQGFDDFEHL